MFEKARNLVLSDRAKAKRALTAEIKRNEQAEIEAELDQLEREERARIEKEEAQLQATRERAQAHAELDKTRCEQSKSARDFDAALSAANAAFERLEWLSTEAARLENAAGLGNGLRPVIVGHARTGALVSATWFSARPLAKRLGLRAVPGSAKSAKPLTTVYSNTSEAIK